MSFRKRLLQLYSLIVLLVVTVPLQTHAAIVNCGPHLQKQCTLADLFQMIVGIYNFLLGLAAIVFMGMIVYSGIRMITHYISESPGSTLNEAKLSLTRSITGLIIIVGAYLIVKTAITLLGGDAAKYLTGQFLTAP